MKSSFELNGGTYRMIGDCKVPNIALPAEARKPLGVWDLVTDAEREAADGESVLKNLSDSFDELFSWAELYDEASFEKKKMIVNCLIKRVEVSRGYKLNIKFNIDFEQFMVGINKVA